MYWEWISPHRYILAVTKKKMYLHLNGCFYVFTYLYVINKCSESLYLSSVSGSHDLLTLMGVRFLPNGVMRSDTADGEEYVITKDAKLSLPASRVYDVTLPSRFSILMELKVHKSKKRRYVFVVSDYERKQQLAVFIGKRIKFQYLGNNYGFKVVVVMMMRR